MASRMVHGAWARRNGLIKGVPARQWSWKWPTDMPTNLFNKPGYFLFQDSAPRMSYPCERIIIIIIIWIIIIWTKWQISVLCDIHILFTFHLIIIRGPILLAKSH